jgi:hypothetical protein
VLAASITETHHIANFDALPGGDQTRVRVTVTDGVNTSGATSAAFTVGTKAPEVFIESPATGARFAMGMSVPLRGSAYDLEDGWLNSSAALIWSSDRDGVLGIGSILNVQNLSVGDHTITLSATDSDGNSATAALIVTVEVPPSGVAISGPAAGVVGIDNIFTGTLSPISATVPITYVWQATGQSPITHTAGMSDTTAFLWDVAGTQTITVTATNAVGTATATHAITITKPGTLGDVNDDGLVDSTDALIILSADVGMNTSQFCPMSCGDANGDGLVNSTDALIILSYDVGMTVPYAVGQPGCPSSVTQPAGCTL